MEVVSMAEVNEIKASKGEKSATILFDFGGNVNAAVEKFGAETVYSNFTRAAVITAQAAMRRMLEDGLAEADIQKKMESWKPGVALERVIDPIAAALNKFQAMTPEAQAAFLQQLKAMKR
jgi:hypothetical protein